MLIKNYSFSIAIFFITGCFTTAFCDTNPAPSSEKRYMSLQDKLAAKVGEACDKRMKNQIDGAIKVYKDQIRVLSTKLCYNTAQIFKVDDRTVAREALAEENVATRMWGLLGAPILTRENINRGIKYSIKRRQTSQETERFEAIWKTYQDSVLTCQVKIVTSMEEITGLPELTVMEILAQHFKW
jgi:hypothetical protein